MIPSSTNGTPHGQQYKSQPLRLFKVDYRNALQGTVVSAGTAIGWKAPASLWHCSITLVTEAQLTGLLTAPNRKGISAEHTPCTAPRRATLAPSGQSETMTGAKPPPGLHRQNNSVSLLCWNVELQPAHLRWDRQKGKGDTKIQAAAG